ncbi:MAG: hypothetical protein ABIY58_15205, partial [Acidimicrobiales bacterium]
AAMALILAVGLVLLPNPALVRQREARAEAAGRERAADKVADLARSATARAHPGEDPGRRQALVGQLDLATRALREADDAKGAVAALSRGQATLQDLGDQSAAGRQNAAAAAGAALAQSGLGRSAGAAMAAAGDPAADALHNLAQGLPGLGSDERAAVEAQLREAAATSGPRDQLLRAADELAAGRAAAAQDALNTAAAAQQQEKAAKAAAELKDLASSLPTQSPEEQAALAKALEQAAAAALNDRQLADALARSARALQQGKPDEASSALDDAARRTESLPAESELDREVAEAGKQLQSVKDELLRCGTASFSAGGGSPAPAPPSADEHGPCSGSRSKTDKPTAPQKSGSPGESGSQGQGGSSGKGTDGKGKSQSDQGQGGAGSQGAGGDVGAHNRFQGLPGTPNEQVFVPGVTGAGRTQDVGSEGTASGTGDSLVPYESVYGQYRAAALSQADRQSIPERRRELIQRYFQDSPP